jgi:hypothetical protein
MGEEFRRVGQQLTSEMNKSKEDGENKSLASAAVNSSMMAGANNTSQLSSTATSQMMPANTKSSSIASRQTAAQQILQQKGLGAKLLTTNTQRSTYSTSGGMNQNTS